MGIRLKSDCLPKQTGFPTLPKQLPVLLGAMPLLPHPGERRMQVRAPQLPRLALDFWAKDALGGATELT